MGQGCLSDSFKIHNYWIDHHISLWITSRFPGWLHRASSHAGFYPQEQRDSPTHSWKHPRIFTGKVWEELSRIFLPIPGGEKSTPPVQQVQIKELKKKIKMLHHGYITQEILFKSIYSLHWESHLNPSICSIEIKARAREIFKNWHRKYRGLII